MNKLEFEEDENNLGYGGSNWNPGKIQREKLAV